MQLRQEYLISYDIEDNRLRGRLYKELAAYGLKSVQKSVFWGYLSTAEITAIKRTLAETLGRQDKAFITRTNFNGQGQSYYIGHHKTDFSDWPQSHVI